MDDRQGRPDHGSAGGRDHGPHRQGPRRALPGARGGVRRVLLHAYRRAGHARAEGTPEQKARRQLLQACLLLGRGHQGRDARRRADHRQADPCPRQQRGDRRTEDRDGERVVRGSAVGHGEHLQDLRGELQRRHAPGRARERGPGARRRRDRRPPMSPPPFPPDYRAPVTGGDTMKATETLHDRGQSLWLDNITRDLLETGTLERYIDELSVTGLTSNPTIFDHAIKNSSAYDAAIRKRVREGKSGEDLFFELALEDLTRAADLFGPIWDRTRGVDGWASLEVSPMLAHDTASTLTAARTLHARSARPNLLIKIPGTKEGLPAIEEAIFAG